MIVISIRSLVNWIFKNEGEDGYSWLDSKYANWIEDSPGTCELTIDLATIPEVRAGEFPNFLALENWGSEK